MNNLLFDWNPEAEVVTLPGAGAFEIPDANIIHERPFEWDNPAIADKTQMYDNEYTDDTVSNYDSDKRTLGDDATVHMICDASVSPSSGTITKWRSINLAYTEASDFTDPPSVNSSTNRIVFDGTEYFELGDTATFQNITETGEFTLGFKVLWDDTSVKRVLIQTDDTGRGFSLLVDGTDLIFSAVDSTGTPLYQLSLPLSGNISTGVWYEVFVIGDGANAKLYLDTVEADSTTISTEAGAHDLAAHVGKDPATTGAYFDGQMQGIYYAPVQEAAAELDALGDLISGGTD